MIYTDTSALMKLVREEAESEALSRWLADHAHVQTSVTTNLLGIVELHRAAARVSPEAVATATVLLARIDKRELTPTAVALASEMPPPRLRTLDALHIASAAELPELRAFVTYDERMASAAEGYGLPVVSPR